MSIIRDPNTKVIETLTVTEEQVLALVAKDLGVPEEKVSLSFRLKDISDSESYRSHYVFDKIVVNVDRTTGNEK